MSKAALLPSFLGLACQSFDKTVLQLIVRADWCVYLEGGTHFRMGGVAVRWGLAGGNLWGLPLLKLRLEATRICYFCPWPKFGLVNFIQLKEQGPFVSYRAD